MDRVAAALHDIESELQATKTEAENAKKREIELLNRFEIEREAFRSRERALVDANSLLFSRADELSSMVTRLQSQVTYLMRQLVLIQPNNNNNNINNGQMPPSPALGDFVSSYNYNSNNILNSPFGINNNNNSNMRTDPFADPDGENMHMSNHYNNNHSHSHLHHHSPGRNMSMMNTVNSGYSAALDKSLDNMRADAATDLERYKQRLMSTVSNMSDINNISTSTGRNSPYNHNNNNNNNANNNNNNNNGSRPTSPHMMRMSPVCRLVNTSTISKTASPSPPPVNTRNNTRNNTNTNSNTNSKIASVSVIAAKTGILVKSAINTTTKKTTTTTTNTNNSNSNSNAAMTSAAASAVSASKAKQQIIAPVAQPSAQVTERSGEIRAAPYDDSSINNDTVMTDNANTTETNSTNNANNAVRNSNKPMPLSLARQQAVQGEQQQHASVTNTNNNNSNVGNKKVSAAEFFAVLRSKTSAATLERLMAALAVFNKGQITKIELMNEASKLLQPDLQVMFENFMKR